MLNVLVKLDPTVHYPRKLRIELGIAATDNTREINYYIDDVASLGSRIVRNETVLEVQADGSELDYIIRNMCNIPYSKNNKTNRWAGDFARFIVENW